MTRVFEIKTDSGLRERMGVDGSLDDLVAAITAQNRAAGRTFETRDTGKGVRFEMTYPQINRVVTGVIRRLRTKAEVTESINSEKQIKARTGAVDGLALHG